MNPLTLVKRIQKINSTEASLGISEDASWHAKYKDSAYVYVGGIPFDLTEGDLLAVFSQYGEIVDVNLVRDKGTGKSKGFAFLAYEDQRSTILAVDNLNGAKLLDRIVRVDHVTKYKKKEEEDEEKEQQKREARGVCRAFQRGDCNRGAACKFSHDEQRSANTGWGAKDSGSRWDHDKYEGPSKRNRKPDHVASDYAPGTKVREEESKLSSADKDGWRSRAEGNDGDRRSHPKRSEPNLKDQDRREIEKRLEKYEKEPYAKENRDRQANEKGPRRHETEPDAKEGRDRQGSDKRSRYDQDEDKPNPKEDRERLGNEKRSRYSEDRDKTNPKDDWNRQGSEKRSRYNEDEDRPNPKEDRERQGSEKRSRYNEERDLMNPKEDRDRRVDEKRLGRLESETNPKEDRNRRGGSEKPLRYGGDETKQNSREDWNRGENEKRHGKYETEQNLKRGRDRGGGEKRSKYD
ncbi:zinc finger CCCH domain-containing protein 25 [Magnolia sinica]|uniref:zinc finger CCCH domain-containing protein 25 n=1 Tax=Magnolia sinica TaxID=86752 RepID=UPI002658C5F7|nr:zinc finger CCCH domain-containing protein 25 [Magnolia sinica]